MNRHEAKVWRAMKRAAWKAAAERRVKKATDREVERNILKRLTGEVAAVAS